MFIKVIRSSKAALIPLQRHQLRQKNKLAITSNTISAVPCLGCCTSIFNTTLTSRQLSSSSSSPEEKNNQTTSTTSTLLYQRHPSRAFFPRILLSLSTVHTGYWMWYVCDFTPAIQSATNAPIDNTTVGYLGLGLALCMSVGSLVYPKSLVQEIRLKQQNAATDDTDTSLSLLEIKTYSLPFITPSTQPIEYKLGHLIIDAPNDVKTIIEKYNGNIHQYDGYLPLHADGRYINLLLQLSDVNEKDEAKKEVLNDRNGQLLFRSLVSPELRSVLDYPLEDGYGDNNGDNNEFGMDGKIMKDRKRRNPEIEIKKQKQRERRLLRRK